MKSKKKILLTILSILIIFLCLFNSQTQAAEENSEECLYLSDIDYIASQSRAGWGDILKDKSSSGSKLSVKVEGAYYTFDKGMWAHATSTLVYDISAYKDKYDYFTTYMGLNNTAASSSNGVKFYIYTSENGKDWDLATIANPPVTGPGANARHIEIPLNEHTNYLKLYADSNGSNGNDHSVYADAKFVTKSYLDEQNSLVVSLAEYDQRIKDYPNKDISDPNYELLLLQRELSSKLGEYALQRFITESEDNKAAIDWLMNDLENIRYYILGGAPSGSYFNSLTELARLLKEYKSDFDITEPISDEGIRRLHNRRPDAPITKGDLYKRMAITLSLTHSTRIGLWMQSSVKVNQSDTVVRYKLYKDLYNNGQFRAAANADITPWFESYTIEEMRFVLQTNIDDEEVLWLNEYTQSKIDEAPSRVWSLLTPHSYLAYVFPNYQNPIFYDDANYEYFNELFSVPLKDENGNKVLDEDGNVVKKLMWPDLNNPDAPNYGITRGTSSNKIYKQWMNFRNKFGTGAVCGGISKSGACIRGVHGIPAAVIGQPGHAAIVYYTQDSNGKGYWGLDNDVSGWTKSEKGERMPLGWGNASYSRGYSVVYMALSQEAMNDQANLEKCQKIMMQAKVYADDPVKQEEIYREALKVQSINIDAWYGLYNAYCANPEKTENDFYDLAEEMAEALKYFPLPMYHLTNLIKPKMVSVENEYRFTLLQTRILNEGKATPNNTADSYTVYQPSLTRTMANYILGTLDTTIATFSFDGEDANKIVLGSRFDGNGVRWDYCLDGNPTGGLEHWTEVSFTGDEEHKLLLTPEEIASITAENDIYIHIVGVNYNEENLYKIDIQESAGLPSTLYANDWENKLIAATPTMMWKLNENDPWTLYSVAEPDLSGDKTVTVKVGATGTRLESKTESTFTFTTNTDPDTRKYISIDHVGLHAFSTEASGQGRYARYAIDGNINTSWHSNWNGNDPDKFIVFKFDEVKNFTALEYFPAPGGNGKIESAQILVSMDGENWTEAVSGTNWTYSNTNDITTKVVDFDPVKALYVKVVGKRTQNSFITAKMFNLYENTTVRIVGTFSFDGDNAKKIILDNDFKGQSWQYSLDGGATWKNGSGDEHQLTDQEANQITAENQIKMRFGGNSTQYTIKINQEDTPRISAYLNDWENRLIGVNDSVKANLQWQVEGTTTWTDYATEEPPRVEGTKKLFIRTKATGNSTASIPVEFQFAEDNNTATKQYIPIEHLAVEGYTSQSKDSSRPYYAPNAIDGNANTIWHSTFDQNLTGKRSFYTIRLDEAKYISAIEFMQKKYRDNDPCLIKSVYVYISDNNQDWVELGRLENIPQTVGELRRIDFAESMSGKYVKIEMVTYDMFTSLSLVNLYEDTTVKKAGSFLFDGENANKIILEDAFKAQNWEYSLDGGETWKRATGDEYTLTAEEVDHVNGDDKIKLRINNVEYVINIQSTATPVITAYLNDLENRLIGMTNTTGLEWKIEGTQTWKDYSEEEPVVEGDAKLLIRQKARNVFAASEIVEFTFTADNQADTRKYIPVSKLSLASVSAEDKAQNGAAANALDGNYNTRWLNSSAGTDTQRYIVIKFDSAIYLSAMDYVPHSENGKILGGTIQGSMDGENFTDIATISGWANNQNTKTIDFEEPTKVRYVKIIGSNTSYTSNKRHVGARMFNFYEDTTKKEDVTPTAEVTYSITEKTNQDVVATLVNPSTEITVLNNGGSTSYTFTENGTFTFEFEDSEGNKGKTEASVDWIIKTLPTPTLTYDYPDPTNKDVTVTVTFDREGTRVTNNDGKNTYTFTENGDFTFEFVGPYGNSGTVTASVDWIIRTLPNATFTYDITEKTNKPVTVTVEFDREGTVVTNNGGSTSYTFTENGEFTFEFRGPYGNEGVATARVDWIDTTTPMADVIYDITEKTNQDVVATLDIGDKNLTITNNDGKNTYTFTENGTFTFEYTDNLGNRGTTVAKVDWIDKVAPNAIISYNIIEATNQEVIATVAFDKKNVTITNNDGKNTYAFTDNGEFTFEYSDEAGNAGSITAKVTWIDKTLPVAEITYSTTNMTNQDVIATISFNKENVTVVGGNTHTFTENGEYEFQFVGPAGNAGVAIAKVTWIDKVAPEPTLVYSTILPTNKDVIAGVTFENEKEGDVIITNNNGKVTHTFEENGEFTFEYTDKAGNSGSVTAVVNWIDRIVPTATISYDITEKTNRSVVATLENESEEITITNNDGNRTYTFTDNGTFTFEFADKAGNTGTAEARVTWIDRRLPVATISYSTTELTNQDVVATVTFDKPNVIVDDGNAHTFTENGEYTFEFEDEAGNNGMATAVVNWIDKVAPTATVEYDVTEETTGNVVAKLVNESEEITLTNNDGNRTYTFTENGRFTFEFVDKAGNAGTAIANVDWIVPEIPADKPSFNIGLTSSKTILNPGDEFEIDVSIENLRNIETGLIAISGKFEYDENVLELLSITGQNEWNMDENSFNEDNFKFVTENGKYVTESGAVIKLIVKVKDTVNQSQETILKVVSVVASNGTEEITTTNKQVKLNIEKVVEETTITSEKYNIEENVITRILPETKFSAFKENVVANREISIINENGEAISDSDIIKSGMTIKVGEELEYSLVVIGDIDKDGRLSVGDFASLKLHLIEKEGYILEGNNLKAADVDGDGTVTITDFAQIKMILIGLMKLEY